MKPGLVAIDGTGMAGNAGREASRDFGEIAREMLAEHGARDEAEDERLGEARGDERPERLRTPGGGGEFFSKAGQKLRGDEDGLTEPGEERSRQAPEFEFEAERIVARTQGRKGWLREADRQLERHRWQDPERISRSRSERLVLAAERLTGDLAAERAKRRLSTIARRPGTRRAGGWLARRLRISRQRSGLAR